MVPGFSREEAGRRSAWCCPSGMPVPGFGYPPYPSYRPILPHVSGPYHSAPLFLRTKPNESVVRARRSISWWRYSSSSYPPCPPGTKYRSEEALRGEIGWIGEWRLPQVCALQGRRGIVHPPCGRWEYVGSVESRLGLFIAPSTIQRR